MMEDVNSFDVVDSAVDSPDVTTLSAGDELPTVTIERLPGAVLLDVAGEIDMMTAPALEGAVRQALAERPATLVIDLTGATFFSSAGIAILMLAHRNDVGVAVRIVATDRVVLRPLELTGLTGDLAIYPAVSSALEG